MNRPMQSLGRMAALVCVLVTGSCTRPSAQAPLCAPADTPSVAGAPEPIAIYASMSFGGWGNHGAAAQIAVVNVGSRPVQLLHRGPGLSVEAIYYDYAAFQHLPPALYFKNKAPREMKKRLRLPSGGFYGIEDDMRRKFGMLRLEPGACTVFEFYSIGDQGARTPDVVKLDVGVAWTISGGRENVTSRMFPFAAPGVLPGKWQSLVGEYDRRTKHGRDAKEQARWDRLLEDPAFPLEPPPEPTSPETRQ